MTITTHKVLLHRLGLSSDPKEKNRIFQSNAHLMPSENIVTMMACSMFDADDASLKQIISQADQGRKLLSDKKKPFEQFEPRRMMISTLRVVAMQASITVSYFLTDQVESESKREELVKEGKLSAKEADRLNEEWEQREWTARWSTFGRRCVIGVLKFQATTLVMRFYEYVASKHVDTATLDRLTKDPFKAALRTAKVTGDTKGIIPPMYQTCLWSNAIAFMADYTVHQIILMFTYILYCREKRRRRLELREEVEKEDSDEEESTIGPMAMSFTMKSSMLIVSRSMGLVGAAMGGAVGSYAYPGWGTTIGTQMGDGFISTLLEERES